MAAVDGQTGPSVEDRKERSDVPIEMNNISATPQGQDQYQPADGQPTGIPSNEQSRQEAASSVEASTALDQASVSGPPPPPPPPDPHTSAPPPLIREATGPAIGPATDKPSTFQTESDADGPVLFITLLLTTGSRHPFRLDRKYLKKRNVEVEDDNPVNMSLYKLKELILRDWRDEWEAKPTSPDSIRLISMGKLLTDKSKLSDFGFKDGAAPTIVHMTIKPQEIVDEEEANKQVRDREGSERTPRCRLCLVM